MDVPGVNFTLRVPPEILFCVFALLTYDELLPVLAVCSRWRDIALDTPTYWSDITVSTADDTTLKTIERRLERADTRLFAFHAIQADLTEDQFTLRVMLRVEQHLEHLRSLELKVTVTDDQLNIIQLILEIAAPQLEEFDLAVVLPDRALAVSLVRLFEGRALRLRKFRIFGVLLDLNFVAAMPSVEQVTLGGFYDPPDEQPEDILAVFPNVRRLTIAQDFEMTAPGYADASRWRSVERLVLGQHALDLEASLILPLASVPHILAPHASEPQTMRLLSHLPEGVPLEIVLDGMTDSYTALGVHLRPVSGAARITRSVYRSQFEWRRPAKQHPLSVKAIAERITSLTLNVPAWCEFAEHLPPIPFLSLVRLTLSSHDNREHEDWVLPIQPLVLYPNLRTIVLRKEGMRAEIAVKFIRLFAIVTLRAYKSYLPLDLRLENVFVHDAHKWDNKLFRLMKYNDGSDWSSPDGLNTAKEGEEP